VSKADFTLKL